MPRPRRSQPRKSKSRRLVDTLDEGWYTIRRVLQERLRNGRIEYLVDWDDNTETGEAYPPSWTEEVTDEAFKEWQRRKAPPATGDKAEESQESQPPRPSNWRQLQRSQTAGPSGTLRRQRSTSDDSNDRPRKVPRAAYSATPSEEPVPSIISASSPGSVEGADVLLGCLTQRDFEAPRSQNLVIELQKDPQFDPSDYASQNSTQHSGESSQSIVELEEQDERSLFASQLTRQTIPDSQEPSGQTWSQDRQLAEPAHSSLAASSDAQVLPNTYSEDAPSNQEPSSSAASSQDSSKPGGEEQSSQHHSNAQDIPSHQFGQADSVSIASQEFNLTTPATKPHSVQSAEGNEDHGDCAVVPPTSPVFLSQVEDLTAFHFPNSSVFTQSQDSPIKSAVAETPSDPKQNSASARSLPSNFAAESQDAQLFHINPFVSHVEAFSDSHDTTHVPPPSTPNASHTVSQPSPERVFVIMEGQDGDGSPNQVPPQPSAVDELSQLLNLDNVMAEGGLAHPTEGPSTEHSDHSEIPATHSDMQEQQQAPPIAHDSSGPESEHMDFNTPPITQIPQSSAVDSMKDIVNKILAIPDLPASGTMMPDASPAHNPEMSTVSLADISKQPDFSGHALPLMPSLLPHDGLSSAAVPSSRVSVSMGQPHQDQESNDGSSDGSEEPIQLKHIITLPFQASLRQVYDDTLLESKRDVTQFGAIFNSEVYAEPDEGLVQKIDRVFSRLHNICDYPPDAVGSVLEDLPSDQLIKYCCDSNPKFNFIYELLQGLTKETRVLIVARSTDLLRLLYRLAEALQVECACEDIGKPKSHFTESLARATLILPGRNVEEDDFDVVIGYDHSFGESVIGKKLEPEIPEAKSPMVFILVTTHSIEHIDLYISDDLTPVERKNALMSGIVRSRQLVSDPDRGYPEPHELASLFLNYLNGQVEGIIWEPIPVPEEVMDIYIGSQSRSQMPIESTPEPDNARKRKLDDSDDEDTKRMRMLPHRQSTVRTNEAPVSDDVKALLASANFEETVLKGSQVEISVPLAALQALAEQNAELKRQVEAADKDEQYKSLISGLEARIKEYERTNAKIYSSQRGALEDRIRFQRETKKAESNLQQAVESTQRDAEKAQKKINDLEATVTRLTANPDAPEDESPLAKTQKLLQESQEKIQMLEKRLENAHKDADYARSLYQDATTTSSALRGENSDLKEQVTDFQKKTADTLGRVQQIQADNTTKQYLGQMRDLKTQLREREIELDCAKDELRQLKNGRRETRQVSVPRSPRMGMMSPRAGRATYGSAAGSTSRGTSPAPTSAADGVASSVLAGMQFMAQPPGNGRWNHLRD